jgi:hypothetical protein
MKQVFIFHTSDSNLFAAIRIMDIKNWIYSFANIFRDEDHDQTKPIAGSAAMAKGSAPTTRSTCQRWYAVLTEPSQRSGCDRALHRIIKRAFTHREDSLYLI